LSAAILERLRTDPRKGHSEMVVMFGKGHHPGFRVVRLFTPEYVPVCSPALLGGRHPLRRPEDLAHHSLIHDDTTLGDAGSIAIGWPEWLRRSGLGHLDGSRGPHFSNGVLALDAAQAGQGVMLAVRPLIRSHLERGSLVIPFDLGVASGSSYHLVMHEMLALRPTVAAFEAWITAEAAHP
ncbi:MAG TPA: LysR substrate-binding domain-containing protein, partial [Holophaga sp.]|nr:LysR substrate-binding domain-containing protein [Holophaga sp.]